MSSIDDVIGKGFEKPEEVKLSEELISQLPSIENLEKPLFATQKGIESFESSVKAHKQALEEARNSSFMTEPPREDLSFELKLLGQIVSSTKEYQGDEITKEDHIRRIIDYLNCCKRGKETIGLYALEKLQHLRTTGSIDGSFSLITYNIGEVEELLAEIVTLDDYKTFFRVIKESGYATTNQLISLYLKNRGFSKEKISFIGQQLASKEQIAYIPKSVEKRESKRYRVGGFYVAKTGVLSFMDQFANELEETFIDPNADQKLLADLKMPMCRYILSVLNEGKVKLTDVEREYSANTVGNIMKLPAHIMKNTQSEVQIPETFLTRYLEYMLNLLMAQQIDMKLKKEKRSHVLTFEKLEKNERYKKPLYKFSMSHISEFVQKLRVAKQCFPYIPFVNANEVEKMWPNFSGIDTEKIFSNEELMEKLRPITYMIFITAVQKKERGFAYIEPHLDKIGEFSISEYGKKNVVGLTPLIPYMESNLPYNMFGAVRTTEDVRRSIREAIQNRSKPRF
jgi:hypothetical protein